MIIFSYGEGYFIEQRNKEIVAKFSKENPNNALDIVRINATQITPAQITQLCLGLDMFVSKKLIFISYLFEKTPSTQLTEVMEYILDQDEKNQNIIVITHAGEVKKNKLFTALQKTKYAKEFEEPSPEQLISFCEEYAHKNGGVIKRSEIQYIISLLGNSILLISQELDKIFAYADGKQVTKEMINLMIPFENYDEIFSLLDAIAQKNKSQALKLFSYQIKKGEVPLMVVSSLARQIRIMIQIKDAETNNPQLLSSQQDFAKTINVHPYALKKSIAQSKNFTLPYLLHVQKYLVSIDKGIKNSMMDPETMIEMMMVKL